MDKNLIYQLIAEEISKASRNKRTQVIHLQMLKYADQLEYVTARDFCDGVGLPQSFSGEFSKMRNLIDRLKLAGLDVSKI